MDAPPQQHTEPAPEEQQQQPEAPEQVPEEPVHAAQVNGEQPRAERASTGWDVRPPAGQGGADAPAEAGPAEQQLPSSAQGDGQAVPGGPGPQQKSAYTSPPPAAASHKRRLDSPAGPEPKRQYTEPGQPQSDTVFRLLVQARKVGSVIGKAGVIVKQIREETGARIRVVEGVPGCDERVIVISSRNDSRLSNSAQEALLLVHKRVIDGEEMGAPGPHGIPLNNLSRLLICQSQAGCLIGKGGAIIKEIRDASGANLKILTPDELPPCALANDRVVQIVGPPEAQFIALQHVSRQLRENAPREWPGGPPPCLTLLSAPAPAPAAPAPAYQQPVQQSYQPAPSYQPQPVYGQQPVGQPVYAPAQPAYQQAPQQQAYAPAQPQHYAPAQPAYGQPRYR